MTAQGRELCVGIESGWSQESDLVQTDITGTWKQHKLWDKLNMDMINAYSDTRLRRGWSSAEGMAANLLSRRILHRNGRELSNLHK